MRLGPRDISAFQFELAIIFQRTAMLRRDRQGSLIIALGHIIFLQLPVGEAQIGQDIGVRAGGPQGVVQLGNRLFIALFVDQADGLDLDCVRRQRLRQNDIRRNRAHRRFSARDSSFDLGDGFIQACGIAAARAAI